MRYVDDTFVIQWEGQKQTFLEHINKVDPTIKFTVEGIQENGTIPSLNTLVKPEADNSLSITVYRKPVHTEQYLQWDSHHNLAAKFSVIITLTHRAKTVCTGTDLRNKEMHHLRKALTKCKSPKWVLDKVERRLLNNSHENSNTQRKLTEKNNNPSTNTTGRDPNKDKCSKGHIVIPYMQDLGESIKKICSKYVSRPTSMGMLVEPKDKDAIDRKSGAIYWYQCGELACNEEYIGETSGTFSKRCKEHLREPSPIHAHNTQT